MFFTVPNVFTWLAVAFTLPILGIGSSKAATNEEVVALEASWNFGRLGLDDKPDIVVEKIQAKELMEEMKMVPDDSMHWFDMPNEDLHGSEDLSNLIKRRANAKRYDTQNEGGGKSGGSGSKESYEVGGGYKENHSKESGESYEKNGGSSEGKSSSEEYDPAVPIKPYVVPAAGPPKYNETYSEAIKYPATTYTNPIVPTYATNPINVSVPPYSNVQPVPYPTNDDPYVSTGNGTPYVLSYPNVVPAYPANNGYNTNNGDYASGNYNNDNYNNNGGSGNYPPVSYNGYGTAPATGYNAGSNYPSAPYANSYETEQNAYLSARFCPSKWDFYRGSCYYAVKDQQLTWTSAEWKCQGLYPGAHLISIRSQEDNAYAKRLMGYSWFWLGCTDLKKELMFQWTNPGSEMSFLNWKLGRPKYAIGKNCCRMQNLYNTYWEDVECNNYHSFICQIVLPDFDKEEQCICVRKQMPGSSSAYANLGQYSSGSSSCGGSCGSCGNSCPSTCSSSCSGGGGAAEVYYPCACEGNYGVYKKK